MKHQKEIDRPSRMPNLTWYQKDTFIVRVKHIIEVYRRGQISKEDAFDDIRDAFFECLEKN